MLDYAWLVLAFPAAGALLNTFLGGFLGRRAVGWLASGAVALAFLTSLGLFAQLMGLPGHERSVTVHLWDWIRVGAFQVPAALLIDPLSITMALVVTGVGTLIHVYSVGYMAEEPRYQRYFVYLNFFVLAMLVLVLSDNFLGMYVGWEGVGLASYLLIGFWFDRRDASYGYYADAGKKAFLVNRVGDFGMALAIMILWTGLGSVTFLDVFAGVEGLAVGTLTLVCLLLLLAATGKSAQIPLYVWLPDAMAGPTPVSALIHAATMVTAGIYMIARTHPLWEAAPAASAVVAWIGGLTALLAASIALVQVDLKKILAYSTISQLGYMMLGVGVGAYAFAIFHLITHAFFKALLFLAAGNVMHGLHGELDIRRMGNLRARMPQTALLFTVGALALAGFPLTSGFFSKDSILFAAFERSPALYGLGLFTALLTAFYSFRAVFVAFWGRERDPHLFAQAHESPAIMRWPLWILAGLALVGGVLNLPRILPLLEHWLEPSVGVPEIHAGLGLELTLMAVGGLVALGGIYLAHARYVQEATWAHGLAQRLAPLRPLLEHRWYVDDLYRAAIVEPLWALARFSAQVVDRGVIDGTVSLVGQLHLLASDGLRRLQNGLVPTYALSLFVGVVVVVLYFVFG